jgi:hypothetical protein
MESFSDDAPKAIFFIFTLVETYMIIQSSDVVWLISTIALSIVGTFVIIYTIKHVMGYFEKRKNR